MPVPAKHFVSGARLEPPFPDGMELALFGMGCFWGAEKMFWKLDGVYSTSVGYAGGFTPNPTYREVCSGQTNHVEAVEVVYDPEVITLKDIVKAALEAHDPTQGYRQGNDVGTQYRSAFYTDTEEEAEQIRGWIRQYEQDLQSAGYGDITTEVKSVEADGVRYYLAEEQPEAVVRHLLAFLGTA